MVAFLISTYQQRTNYIHSRVTYLLSQVKLPLLLSTVKWVIYLYCGIKWFIIKFSGMLWDLLIKHFLLNYYAYRRIHSHSRRQEPHVIAG